MGPGKAKIAIMMMPFQLHLRRGHDRLTVSFKLDGLWHFLGLICSNSPLHSPNTGNQLNHFDFAENIISRGQK
jgi:hypothetical protein